MKDARPKFLINYIENGSIYIYNSRKCKQISYNGKHISGCLGKCVRRAKIDALQRDIKKQLGGWILCLLCWWFHGYIHMSKFNKLYALKETDYVCQLHKIVLLFICRYKIHVYYYTCIYLECQNNVCTF